MPIPPEESRPRKLKEINLERKWTVIELIGSGGFGRVFRVESLGEICAIKLVPKSEEARRELKFAEGSKLPHVVPILEIGEYSDFWALRMPLAKQSLRDHMKEHCPSSIEEALSIVKDICQGLDGLDEQIVHRDIKPENVLLIDSLWCLADFGISRYVEVSTSQATHKFAMTPQYASPERWRAKRATPSSDIYSLGVLLYELIVGELPFTGPDFRDQHLHDSPPQMPNVPSQVRSIVQECLLKAPGARPSASNILARLSEAVEGDSSPGRSKLAEANFAEVERRAANERERSIRTSKAEEHLILFESGASLFKLLGGHLLEEIVKAAPTASMQSRTDLGWTVRLGNAVLQLSEPEDADNLAWKFRLPPFAVIAHAGLSLKLSSSSGSWQGRSHSLWYCDAEAKGEFSWFEVAFMTSPLIAKTSIIRPFALEPGEESAGAIGPGLTEFQLAWPFERLDSGELGGFVERWIDWFADFALGKARCPSQFPEKPTEGSWRK